MTGNAKGGGMFGRMFGSNNTANVGARVNVSGMKSLVSEANHLSASLRKVREELVAINKLASKTSLSLSGKGVGGSPFTSSSPSTFAPPSVSPFPAPTPPPPPAPGGAPTPSGSPSPALSRFALPLSQAYAVKMGIGVLSNAAQFGVDRFNRNMNESIPISQANMLLSSQYRGLNYKSMDWDRVKALGNFAGSRTEALAAQATGFGYGQSVSQNNAFLSQTVAPMVQFSGGTQTASQAAQSAGAFLGVGTMRRASAMGVGMGRIGGQVRNPLTVAMGYIKDYERRYHVKLNSINFENMRAPGSAIRYAFQRLYQLDDEALDMVQQAGSQNATFNPSGTGRDINFSSSADAASIGMKPDRLGNRAFQYMSASANREARFFQNQEHAMGNKLSSDTDWEKRLSDYEQHLGGVIGALGEFQRYIKIATTALGGLGSLAILGALGGGGGGGGLVGGIGKLLGLGGGAGAGGAGGAGGALGGGLGAGGMSMGAGIMGAAALGGAGYLAAGAGAKMGGAGGAALGIGGTAAAWGAAGALLGGGPIGAGIGALAGASYGAYKYFGAMHDKDVGKAIAHAMGMTEAEIFANGGMKRHMNPYTGSFGTAGPIETGEFDVLQMRRGSMTASLLDDMIAAGLFKNMSTDKAQQVAQLKDFFASQSVKNDEKYSTNAKKFNKLVGPYTAGGVGRSLMNKYFGSLTTPFDMQPVGTDVAKSLVASANDILGAPSGSNLTSANSGDPITNKGGSGATWDNIDPALKGPLTSLLQAGGGRVWLGNGWRSSAQQEAMFRDRYVPDPNGDMTWQGKKWKRVKGAPATPPGQSMHEIGRAADLEGDMTWLQQNAGKFGLRTFAGVNREPWHVQLSSDPESRAAYEKGGTSAGSGGAIEVPTEAPPSGGTSSGGGGGGGASQAVSGAYYQLGRSTADSGSIGGSGGNWGGAAGTAAAGTMDAGPAAGGGPSMYSAAQIAKFAYNAGFRGTDLVNFVAIAMRESGGGNARATNEKGPDMSYGLFQINLKPWLDKGEKTPYTKEQLYDPQFNANVAYQFFQQSGMKPWNIKGNPLAKTHPDVAQAAVAAAGLSGDPSLGSGGGGSYTFAPQITVHATIHSTGNPNYDADRLAAVAAAKIQEAAQMAMRRSG